MDVHHSSPFHDSPNQPTRPDTSLFRVIEKKSSLGIATMDLSPVATDTPQLQSTSESPREIDGVGVYRDDDVTSLEHSDTFRGMEPSSSTMEPTNPCARGEGNTKAEDVQSNVANSLPQGRISISSASSAGPDDTDTTTPLTSTPPSECGNNELAIDVFASSVSATEVVLELYAENIIAKALRTAQGAIGALPFAFPEIVPQDTGCDGSYSLREADFWTCGFFPGTLYLLLERLIKFPQSVRLGDISVGRPQLRNQLTTLCRTWSEPIRGMDTRTDTHDIGFIVMPALRLDWELFGNLQSLESIVRAARSLATRYVPTAGAIRSWDLLKKKDIEILDQTDNMIVIIDSMCNLDFYASHHAQDPSLADIATAHALTLLKSHLRPESGLPSARDSYRGQWYSTCHVANIDPKTGELKRRLSAQGYSHESTWSRGQAWAILGYAETYKWTKDHRFLEVSCGLAEYFLFRLETAPACVSAKGRYVPLWDFDAPVEDEENPLRDSSSGVIAANGLLLLSQALATMDQPTLALRYRNAAFVIVQDTLEFALAPEKAHLVSSTYHYVQAEEERPGVRFDGLLKFGTANNNAQARKRYANHGLVYGDYYLVEFGNRLLRMGLH